jgi:hypothetical protein
MFAAGGCCATSREALPSLVTSYWFAQIYNLVRTAQAKDLQF